VPSGVVDLVLDHHSGSVSVCHRGVSPVAVLAEVDERPAPRTKATVADLMDRYLGMLDVEDTTMDGYEGHVHRNIKSLLGHIQVGRIDARPSTPSTASCGAAAPMLR
jgi:hypothetical protein